MEQIYKIKGKVQHYDWGGSIYIPKLLDLNNKEKEACAEYWLGTHNNGDTTVEVHNKHILLKDMIQSNLSLYLNLQIAQKYKDLPYLLKILDVEQPLSIQVHPNQQQAIQGFNIEEKENIPLDAPHRNYKDRNEKSEILLALSNFWLLHGLKKPDIMSFTLSSIPCLQPLLSVFNHQDYTALYQFVMQMPLNQLETILEKLIGFELIRKEKNILSKIMPGYWLLKYVSRNPDHYKNDRALLSLYLLNIVNLNRGESIVQQAGTLHAYLEGQGAELMNNSDNIIRGGLTKKHVDIKELLNITQYQPIIPSIKRHNPSSMGELQHPLPHTCLVMSKIKLEKNIIYKDRSYSLCTFIVIAGEILIEKKAIFNSHINIQTGESFIVLPSTYYQFKALVDNTIVIKAFITNEE